jgi:hypothetical protein
MLRKEHCHFLSSVISIHGETAATMELLTHQIKQLPEVDELAIKTLQLSTAEADATRTNRKRA